MKRFYTHASTAQAEDGWHVLLDQKPVRTPAGQILACATEIIAKHIAQEWQDQPATINPETMPVTQLQCTLQDKAVTEAAVWRQHIHAYLDGDGLVYICREPVLVRAAQDTQWQPLRAAFEHVFGQNLAVTEDIRHIQQAPALHQAIDKVLDTSALSFIFGWSLAASELGSSVLGWHVVAADTSIDTVVEASLLEDLFNDRISSPDGRNMDPMLEKRVHKLHVDLGAIRRFSS